MNAANRILNQPRFGDGPCLDRMAVLLRQHAPTLCPGIKITGSNGKGSTAAMTAAILRAHGLRVGLFTSPHLLRIHERIQLNGTPISEAELQRTLARIPDGPYGAFELLTVAAASWFAEKGADVAVWEAGIGGRLDATRPLPAPVSALVHVSLEHQKLLGNTRIEIALDKAQLAAPGTTLVVGPLGSDVLQALHAQSGSTQIVSAKARETNLPGTHQRANAGCAYDACQHFLGPRFSEEKARSALLHVSWPGRFEEIAPALWVDVAHNLSGVIQVAKTAKDRFGAQPIVLVIGVSNDRDAENIVQAATTVASEVIATSARHKGSRTGEIAEYCPVPCHEESDVAKAVAYAQARARALDGVVLVTGGLFLVAEAIASIRGEDPKRLQWSGSI